VTPETAECGVLGRREELRRETRKPLSVRRAMRSQPDEAGKPLESVATEVCISVEPEQLRVAVARPGDPVRGQIVAEVGLEDAEALGRDRLEKVVQSRMRAMSSSRRRTRCAVPARRTS
jgi:hypothetical protein